MITEVVMPQMGADMKEGTILRWLKAEGDPVRRGEIIAEIETDKANIEIEAFGSGVFRKIIGREGETMPVGAVMAVIAQPTDDISKYEGGSSAAAATPPPAPAATQAPPAPAPVATPPAPTPPAPERAQAPAAAPAAPTAAASLNGRLRASPLARRIAQERGVDLQTVRGTGPSGRILRRDVEAAPVGALAVAAVTAGPREDVVTRPSLNRIRQATARRMQDSKQQAPHYYLTRDIDMTEALRLRAQINAALGDNGRVSVNDLIILAVTKTLQRHPRFNSWWVNDQLEVHSRINVGVAVALDDGLVAPALLDTDTKSLTQLSREARDLAERARSGSGLSQEEYSAGTFTITNLGAYGVDTLIGIINPPQTAILGVGTARERAVVVDGQVVVRSMMTAALSADHRATNGAEGAQFLATLAEMLEKPALMLV